MAILTNIVRASRYEPLNFVSLTGFTGHDTFSSALPSFVLPPANPVSFTFGNTSASTVFSNDFNVSVLDDPGSYAALLEPINPALMGLFIKAGYPRELIYLLFFDYVKISDKGGVAIYKNFPEPTSTNAIDGTLGKWFPCGKHVHGEPTFNKTVCKIESLVRQGLTVDIDSDFQPSADVIPSYRFCFDPNLPIPVAPTKYSKGLYFYPNEPENRNASPQCDPPKATNTVTGWTQPESGNPTTTITVIASGKNATTKQATLLRPHRASYTVLDSGHDVIEIHTRSVLGAYQYLGQILHYQFTDAKLQYADTEDDTLLDPARADAGQCFASVIEDGETYCIEKSAANTKRIFSLLRQLTGLLTKPNNQAATPTVRNTPN